MLMELNVKPGDKVIINTRWNGSQIGIVDKVTPTGRIKIKGSYHADKYGYQVGGDSWGRGSISIATKEKLEEINQKNLISQVVKEMQKLKSISYEDAIKINKILKNSEV